MIVCLCHRISDRDIREAVRTGTHDFETLQDETCIARNCGCCEDCAVETFEEALAKHAASTSIAAVTNLPAAPVPAAPRRVISLVVA
ncbi:(2Fe-2S)-binding protein [Azohydromonas australica]|uniref:(2Fe-2S)-binding protein n=1 Tax=Azohydromonas australica TaxID=364039 RepID=UPI00041651F5|nr:(2Fe-2S)-binding protein [Azohydromonas australica]